MGWSFFGPLIVRYGIEGAYKIAAIIAEHGEPTQEAWAKLLALGLKSEADYIKEAMERAGYAPGAPLPPWVLPPDAVPGTVPPQPPTNITIGWPLPPGPTGAGSQ